MDSDVTKQTIQSLAAANGLALPDGRLDRVLKQYQIYLRLVERLDAYPLPMESEPSTVFTLAGEMKDTSSGRRAGPAARRSQQQKGESRGNR
jgi:hypothetical protein